MNLNWWNSSQPARCTYNLKPDLLGSFPANVRPDITGHFGCGLRAKFSPSAGQLGGGRFLTNNTNNTILDTKSPQTTWVVYFRENLSFQGQIFRSAYFEEHIHWVPLEIVTVMENPKVRLSSSLKIRDRSHNLQWSIRQERKQKKTAVSM